MKKTTTLLAMAILTSISCNALNYFWVGGSGNWSDYSHHWAVSSGGSTFHTQVPQSTDNVFFDALSFTPAMHTVTVDQTIIQCADMTWTGLPTIAPTLVGNSTDTLRIFGSLTLFTGMTFNIGHLGMEAITAKNITTAGTVINASLAFNGVGGTWTLQDALTVTNTINLNNGNLITNNQTVNALTFYSSTTSVRSLIMGSSTFNISNFWYINPSGMILNATNSTINCTGPSNTYQFFLGGGFAYNDVFFTGGAWGYIYDNNILHDVSFVSDGFISGNNIFHDVSFAANATINGLNSFNNVSIANNGTINNSNTFNNLTFSPFYSYTLEAGQTQTVENICAKGTGALPIRIQSSAVGLPAIISKASGTMCWDYVHVSDITATGGATFNAGLAPTNSQDLGGNTGLLFTGGCIFVPCTSCTPPVITAQPSNSNVCTDGNTVFEIFATGTGLTYQWQVNDGSGFTNLFNTPPYSGVTTNTLNITSVALPANGYQYHCIVSGTCDSIIISNEGTLTVNSLPTVTANSATICSGQTAILTANGATNYVWSIGGMMGDTTNPISVSPLTTTAYIVTGTTNGCSNSAIATVTVNPLPIINAGQDATVLSNTPVQLGTTSFPALSYSWSPIAGLSNANVSNPTLVLQNNSSTPQTYTYILTANNGQCSKSDTVLITVLGSQPIPIPNPNLNLNQISDSAFTQSVIPCGVSPEYFKSLGKTQGGPKSLPQAFPTNLIEHCGKFDVYYEDLMNGSPLAGYSDPGFGASRIDVLCDVLNYVQTVFDFSNVPAARPIRLHVLQSYSGLNPAPNTARFLAAAGPGYFTNGAPIVNGFVYDYATSGTGTDPISLTDYHAELMTNFDQAYDGNGYPIPIPWNNTISPATTNCLFDLWSVLFHEITHTLGWTSLVHINHNTNQLEPLNAPLNIFSGIDALLHRSPTPAQPVSLQPLLTGFPNPIINPSASTSPNNDFWISGNAAPDNHPVYSELLFPVWTGSRLEQSFLSHMDGQMWLYSMRSKNSPGDVQDYVMQPYSAKGVLRRTYTDIEINTLNNLGYTIHPNFNGANLPNLPPYSTKMAGYNILNYSFPETVPADVPPLTNNIGSFQDINIATDPGNMDPESDAITYFPGSLVNIRGCGSGGNNHNQLTDLGNGVIRFTPRPNFFGRAQFGLKLFDGSEVGSYVIYTIDVTRGTNVGCAGSNMILNGDFEEGTEVKRVGSEETIDASQAEDYQLKEGKVRTGIHFADCQPFGFTSNNWFPYGSGDIIQDSWIQCNGTTYRSDAGAYGTSFPNPGSNAPKIDAFNGVGQRYKQLQWDYMYFNLCSDMQNCEQYVLEFDLYAQPFFIDNGTTIPLTVGFTNAATYPGLANLEYNFIHNITIANNGNTAIWQHVSIPFTYCASTATNILNLRQSIEGIGIFIDNLVLKVNPNPPLTTVTITPVPAITCSSIDLYSHINNHVCMDYLWSTGETTENITVTPTAPTTIYTLTVSTSPTCGQPSVVLSATNTVTKIPMPTISLGPNPSVCKGATTANLTYSGTTTADQYSIRYDPAALIAGFSDVPYPSTPNLPASPFVLPIPPGALPGTYNFTLKIRIFGTDGCEASIPATITIKPVPVATANQAYQFICTETASSLTLSSIPTGATFSWTALQTTDVSGASAGTGNTIAQTLTVGGATPSGTATYTITPELNGCVGNPITVVVTVSKIPDVTATPSSQTICSGNGTSIALTGTQAGTQFAWSAVPLGVLGTLNGSGTPIAQTLTTSATTAGTATYNITPYLNACPGTPIDVTVSVNPTPVATASSASQTFCSTGTTAIALSSDVAGTDFAWTVNQTGVTGATNGFGTNIEQILNITGNTPGTAVYTITPTVTATGCSGTPITVTIYINPIPVATATPSSQTICSGGTASMILFSDLTGTTYSWTVAQTGVAGATGASNFSGASISQTLTATGTVQGNAVYTITPTVNGCSGNLTTVTVTVNPLPVVTAFFPAGQTICSGVSTTIALTSNVAGTDFAWTVSQTNVLGATSGSGTSISQILNTTGNTQGTAVYTVTPTVTATGCSGTPIIFAIIVNPVPTISVSPSSQSVCSGSPITPIVAGNPNTVSGTTFTWTRDNNTYLTGMALSGTGSPIIGTLTNTNVYFPQTTTFIITATANGCSSTTTATVTVNPLPLVNVNSPNICNGLPVTLTANGNGIINYVWSAGATTQSIIVPATPATYTVTGTNGNGCSNSAVATVTVNTMPVATAAPSSQTICSGTAFTPISLSSTPLGAAFSWTVVSSNNVSGAMAGTGNSIAQALGVQGSSGCGAATYTITPTLNGCTGNPITAVVTVNKKPSAIATPSSQTICTGSTTSIALSSNCQGTTFSWTYVQSGVSGATASSGTNIAQTLTTTQYVQGTATYTATPSCGGSPITVVVTVKPTPSAVFSYGVNPYCQFGSNPFPTFGQGGVAGTFTSSPSVGLVFVSNTTGQINLSASTPGTYTITNNIAGVGGCPATITTWNANITISPKPIAGFSYSGPYFKNCGVNPLPTLNTGGVAGTFSSTPLGLVFVSTLTGQINLSASTPGTYTVTNAIVSGAGCLQVTAPASVIIYPKLVASATPLSQTICSGGTTGIALTSNSSLTIFSWSVVQTNVTGASAGSGSTITQSLSTTVGGTAVYTVTPTANGCVGNPFTVTITVGTTQCTGGLTIDKFVPCNGTSTSDVFPGQSLVQWKNISISGVLTVNTNITFENCNFVMAPGASIVMNKNLTISNKTHIFSCDAMWDGIYVNGIYPTPTLTIKNDAFIEDAINAVVLTSFPSGTCKINDAIFNRNLIAVKVNVSHPSFFTFVHSIVTSRANLYSTTATVANLAGNLAGGAYPKSNLKAPYTDRTGLYGINVLGGNIQVGIDAPASTNTFDAIMCGINLTSTNATIYNNKFQYLLLGQTILCDGGQFPLPPPPCLFEAGYGIKASGSTTSIKSITIGGSAHTYKPNTFYNTYGAINITAYHTINIVENSINNGSTFTPSSPLSTTGYGSQGIYVSPITVGNNGFNIVDVVANTIKNCNTGIWVNRNAQGINSKRVFIDHNTVTADASGHCTNGISITDIANYTGNINTLADKIKIQFNTVTQAYNCITTTNVKKSLVIRGNAPLVVRNNGTTAGNGIRLQNCKYAKVHENTDINVSSPASPVIGTNIIYKGIYVISSTDSKITCNNISNMGESMTFMGLCISSTLSNNKMTGGNRGLVLRNNGEIGAQGSTNLPCGLWWNSTFAAQTYTDNTTNANTNSKLYVNNTNRPSTSYTGVPASNLGGNPLYYYSSVSGGIKTISATYEPKKCIDFQISTLRSLGSGNGIDSAQLVALAFDTAQYPVYEQEHRYQHKLYAFDELDAGIDSSAGIVLQHFYDSTQIAALGQLKAVDTALANTYYSQADVTNSAVLSGNLIEANQQEFNTLYLLSLNDTAYYYTQAEKNTIYAIAEQCPLEGGNAVWQARVLFCTIENNLIEFDDNCTGGSKRMMNANNKAESTNFILYPNPNDGTMQLAYILNTNETGIFELYDITGKHIASYVLNSSSNKLNIDNIQLNAGLYYYNIRVNEKVIKTDKIVIIK